MKTLRDVSIDLSPSVRQRMVDWFEASYEHGMIKGKVDTQGGRIFANWAVEDAEAMVAEAGIVEQTRAYACLGNVIAGKVASRRLCRCALAMACCR